MAPETLIVKTTDHSYLLEVQSGVRNRYPKLSWLMVSTCPLRRSELSREHGRNVVLNPFQSSTNFYADVIWVEDWPSLMGDRFEEFNYLLFSSCKLLILGERYRAPHWAMRRLSDFSPEFQYIISEKVPRLPLFPILFNHCLPIKWSRQILWQKYKIYRDYEIDFFVGLDVRTHSYFMNYANSHSLIGMNSSGITFADWGSLLKVIVTYLRVHLRREWNSLVDYHYEHQNRGNSNSQGSLSRSTYYWNALTSYGKESLRSLLRGTRWWQEA